MRSGWLSRVLDLVFAPACAACDERITRGRGLCDVCEISLEPLGAACPRCARPIAGPAGALCRGCSEHPPPFERIESPFLYGGELATALRRLKFGGRRDVARTLAPLFATALARTARGCDLIMPVPLHRRRLARRGFNQVALLIRHAGSEGMPPVDALSLRRVRATAPQTGLDARSRRDNVRGAFAVAPGRIDRVRDRRILLCDDVVTTGATMAAASRALVRAGAASVIGFSVARADS